MRGSKPRQGGGTVYAHRGKNASLVYVNIIAHLFSLGVST